MIKEKITVFLAAIFLVLIGIDMTNYLDAISLVAGGFFFGGGFALIWTERGVNAHNIQTRKR